MSTELLARLNDREYTNWLKAGRCLLILKRSLQPFTCRHMSEFHGELLRGDPLLRRRCETNACRPRDNKLSCACRVCSRWQTAIMRHHRQPGSTVNWDNCFPPSWRTDYWEVAKAYMPRGQGKVKGAAQCDASALLNLINYCDRFQSVDPRFVREVIRYRNELMHSCELGVEDDWMRRYQKSLKHLLQQFSHVPQMATAGQEIDEMLSVDLLVCVSGWDRLDGEAVFHSASACDDKVVFHSASACDDKAVFQSAASDGPPISQWEAELLQERLQELLHANDNEDAKTRDTEQLKRLGAFLRANRDLGNRFSAELQAIDSLLDRQ